MELTTNKINIFVDIRTCSKCGDPADVVEKGTNYCADCLSRKWTGKNINTLTKEVIEDDAFLKVVKP